MVYLYIPSYEDFDESPCQLSRKQIHVVTSLDTVDTDTQHQERLVFQGHLHSPPMYLQS